MEQGFYAIIPATVRYDNKLTPNAKLLYGEITALCNKEGFCWAANTYFADLYGVSERSIQRWINSLIEYGHLLCNYQYAEDGKQVLRRCLTIAYGQKCQGVTKLSGGDTERQEGDKIVVGGGDKIVGENNTNNNNIYPLVFINKNIPPKGGNTVLTDSELLELIEQSFSDTDVKNKFKDYVTMRAAQGKNKAIRTRATFNCCVSRLRKYAKSKEDAIEILDNSIANNWTGICELKKQKGKREEIEYVN